MSTSASPSCDRLTYQPDEENALLATVRSVDPLGIDDRDHVDQLGISNVDFENCSVIAALNRERGPAASDLPAGESRNEVPDERKSFVVSHVGQVGRPHRTLMPRTGRGESDDLTGVARGRLPVVLGRPAKPTDEP